MENRDTVMRFDYGAVNAAIRNAVAQSDTEGDYSPEQIVDIAYHMTDWLKNLQEYAAFCDDPSSYSTDEVAKMLMAFLYHVPNHIAAAAKLYLDSPVRDVFGVGAVEATEKGPE